MPWNDTTKIMTAPLNINGQGDIQKATGCDSGDLGYCIVNGSINKWAKWKPQRMSKITPLTLAERTADHFGLALTKYTTVAGLMAGIQVGGDWAYLQPRDNGSDGYRMFDFLNASDITATGYIGNAKSFLDYLDVPSIYFNGTGGTNMTVEWVLDSRLPAGNILMADLSDIDSRGTAFNNLYLGFIIVDSVSSPTVYRYRTSSAKISADSHGTSVTWPANDLDTLPRGSYYVFPLAAKTQCDTTQVSADNINLYLSEGAYALPDVGIRTISVTLTSASIWLYHLSAKEVANGISYEADIEYSSNHTVMATGISVRIYTSDTPGTEQNPGTLLGTYLTQESIELTTAATKFKDAYGVYYVNDTKLQTAYGEYITAVLTYTVGGSTYTTIRTIRVGDEDHPV